MGIQTRCSTSHNPLQTPYCTSSVQNHIDLYGTKAHWRSTPICDQEKVRGYLELCNPQQDGWKETMGLNHARFFIFSFGGSLTICVPIVDASTDLGRIASDNGKSWYILQDILAKFR